MRIYHTHTVKDKRKYNEQKSVIDHHPLDSLKQGHWFKLICGASFQHLPSVRNLTLAYVLAGADCIDVAADPGVIFAALEGLQVAQSWGQAARERGFPGPTQPLLMVSINDGEDQHFRKATFNPDACPTECWRPCEKVCPAGAIVFGQSIIDYNQTESIDQFLPFSGVIDQRCYGCGRCLPVCPSQLMETRSYITTPETVLFKNSDSQEFSDWATGIEAIEIHTQIGREDNFRQLWQKLQHGITTLKLLAISCNDGEGLIDYLWTLYQIITPLPCSLIWQTDGRSMSGDIGDGTTRATIKLGEKVLGAGLPGYVQLAGGTNDYTVPKLKSLGLLKNGQLGQNQAIAGVAYGSYARVLLSPILEQLETIQTAQYQISAHQKITNNEKPNQLELSKLEAMPDLLWQAVSLAYTLTSQLKGVIGNR